MNAKEELLQALDRERIKCAKISIIDIRTYSVVLSTSLRVGHTEQEHKVFLKSLDIEYEAEGFCIQELYGTVWLTDGTWFDRISCDGSLYWEKRYFPEIPKELEESNV